MSTGGLSGGEALQKYLEDIAARLGDEGSLRVGFLEGATYPDGTPVPMVAATQEFGTDKIPPRPFFRNMLADKSTSWGDDLAAILQATDYDAEKALGMMGERIKGQLQESIVDLKDPPNAPSTLRQKAGSNPLIDTGHMRNSVDYEVDV